MRLPRCAQCSAERGQHGCRACTTDPSSSACLQLPNLEEVWWVSALVRAQAACVAGRCLHAFLPADSRVPANQAPPDPALAPSPLPPPPPKNPAHLPAFLLHCCRARPPRCSTAPSPSFWVRLDGVVGRRLVAAWKHRAGASPLQLMRMPCLPCLPCRPTAPTTRHFCRLHLCRRQPGQRGRHQWPVPRQQGIWSA